MVKGRELIELTDIKKTYPLAGGNVEARKGVSLSIAL